MSELKINLRIARISNVDAVAFLKRHHPLGAGGAFKFAFGAFYSGRCEGVLTFGSPSTNHATTALALRQCDVLELRKMVLTDVPPKNSESRALAIAGRLVRQAYPQIYCLLTYCEGEEAAAAYRGSGWQVLSRSEYIAAYKIGGKWYTARDAHRSRIADQATETKTAKKQKLILILNACIAQRVEHLVSSEAMAAQSRPARSISREIIG